MKKVVTIFLLMIILILTGCAQNAAPQNMTAVKLPTTQLNNKNLRHAITVAEVTGGHETNPLWMSKVDNNGFKEALEKSLQLAKLYDDKTATAKYKLNVNLTELKQPYVGFDLTVACKAHYSLLDIESQQKIYDQDIASKYTAKFSDSAIAIVRLKLANEGAIRENIEKFLAEIYKN